MRAPFYVNLGMMMIVFYIVRAYVGLVSSMADTGLLFVIGGIGLVALGIVMERKRRRVLEQIETSPQLLQ